MDILQAARQLRPGTVWNLRGDSLEQVEDGSPRVDIPTLEEIQTVLNETAYQDARRPEYPPIGDQLDALWKGGQAAADMLAKIQSVKEKYPKP